MFSDVPKKRNNCGKKYYSLAMLSHRIAFHLIARTERQCETKGKSESPKKQPTIAKCKIVGIALTWWQHEFHAVKHTQHKSLSLFIVAIVVTAALYAGVQLISLSLFYLSPSLFLSASHESTNRKAENERYILFFVFSWVHFRSFDRWHRRQFVSRSMLAFNWNAINARARVNNDSKRRKKAVWLSLCRINWVIDLKHYLSN